MAVGQIPAAAIDRFTQGWADDDALLFRLVIRKLDSAYLEDTKPSKDGKQAPQQTVSSQPFSKKIFRSSLGLD